jgi:hypothetical protein
MFTFPKIMIPSSIKDAKLGKPYISGAPIEPKKPIKKDSPFIFYIFFLVVLFFITLTLSTSSEVIFPLMLIMITFAIIIYFYTEIKTKIANKSLNEKYRSDFKKYNDSLSDYNWRKREIYNNPIEIKKYRKKLVEEKLKYTKAIESFMDSQKGASESSFEIVLKSYFGDKILTNRTLGNANFSIP